MPAESTAAPPRIAHCWTEHGIADVTIADAWPELIIINEWAYRPNLDIHLRPLVRCGRFSGVESVEYKTRVLVRDLPAEHVAGFNATEVAKPYGDKRHPAASGSTEGAAGTDARGAAAGRRRRPRHGSERSDAIQDR